MYLRLLGTLTTCIYQLGFAILKLMVQNHWDVILQFPSHAFIWKILKVHHPIGMWLLGRNFPIKQMSLFLLSSHVRKGWPLLKTALNSFPHIWFKRERNLKKKPRTGCLQFWCEDIGILKRDCTGKPIFAIQALETKYCICHHTWVPFSLCMAYLHTNKGDYFYKRFSVSLFWSFGMTVVNKGASHFHTLDFTHCAYIILHFLFLTATHSLVASFGVSITSCLDDSNSILPVCLSLSFTLSLLFTESNLITKLPCFEDLLPFPSCASGHTS